MNRRLRGHGLDIDPKLVEESTQRVRNEGLADRVRFEHRNAFDVDLRDATVITMWLFPELMRLLRPIILERATPGTRVLASTWDLGAWQADKVEMDQLGLTRHEFSGKVAGDQIVGTVSVTPAGQSTQTLPWRARRSGRSDYFAPAGTAMFQQP